jgi:hypothetical protein
MAEINYDKYLDLLKSNNTEKIEKVTKINFSNTNSSLFNYKIIIIIIYYLILNQFNA